MPALLDDLNLLAPPRTRLRDDLGLTGPAEHDAPPEETTLEPPATSAAVTRAMSEAETAAGRAQLTHTAPPAPPPDLVPHVVSLAAQRLVKVGPTEFFDFADRMADLMAKATGLPKGGLFKSIANLSRPEADQVLVPHNLGERIVASLSESITGALPKLALATAAGGPIAGFAGLGALEAAGRGDAPLTIAEEAIRGGLLGLGFMGLEPLTRAGKAAGGAILGGVDTATRGGSPEDIAASAGTMAIMAATAPSGGTTIPQAGRMALETAREGGRAVRGLFRRPTPPPAGETSRPIPETVTAPSAPPRPPIQDDLGLAAKEPTAATAPPAPPAAFALKPTETTTARPTPTQGELIKPEFPTGKIPTESTRTEPLSPILQKLYKQLETEQAPEVTHQIENAILKEWARVRGEPSRGETPRPPFRARQLPATSTLTDDMGLVKPGEAVTSARAAADAKAAQPELISATSTGGFTPGVRVEFTRGTKPVMAEQIRSLFPGQRIEVRELLPYGEEPVMHRARQIFEVNWMDERGAAKSAPPDAITKFGVKGSFTIGQEPELSGRAELPIPSSPGGKPEVTPPAKSGGGGSGPGLIGPPIPPVGPRAPMAPSPQSGPLAALRGGPPAPKDIVDYLSKELSVALRFGTPRVRKNVLGFFKVKPEVIRTRYANDVETTAHEIGHYLEKALWGTTKRKGTGLTGKAFSAFRSELVPIATTHNAAGNATTEGFAEFVRLYVTDPAKAQRVAPRFYPWFEGQVDAKAPEVRQVLLRARASFAEYLAAPSTSKVRAHISRVPTQVSLTVRSAWDWFYTHFFDRLDPIRRAKRAFPSWKDLPADQDPELLARTFAGWVRKADWFVRRGPSDWATSKQAGPGLPEILKEVQDAGKWNEFWDYAASARAVKDLIPRFGRPAMWEKTGLRAEVWEETFAHYDSPQFQRALEGVHRYQEQVFNYWADSYGLTITQRAQIRKLNQARVPFYRLMDEPGEIREAGRTGTGKGFADLPNPIKTLKGSTRAIIDPAESVLKDTFAMVNLAERNAVGKSLVDWITAQDGGGRLVERVPGKLRPTTIRLEEIRQALETEGLQLPMGELEGIATIFRPTATREVNHITVFQGGEHVVYRVHPELYRAMLHLDHETTNLLTKLLRPPAQWLRVGATSTPEFMASNIFRDQWSAAINAGTGLKQPYFTVKGFFEAVNQGPMYDLWVRGGGAQSTFMGLERAEIQKRLKDLFRDPRISRTIVRHPWQSVRLLSQLYEEATRVGVMGSKIQDPRTATKAQIVAAAAETREATIDFSRNGAATSALSQIVAFWRPQIQGLDKVRRTVQEHPVRFALTVGAGVTLPSIYLAATQHDDPRWKEIPQWQRDIAWIVITGPKVSQAQWDTMTMEQRRQLSATTVLRLPKPWEIGVLFGSVPERIIEWAYAKDERLGEKLAQSIITAFGTSLLPIPTVLVPILENLTNRSNFTGRPIVPRAQEEVEPRYQYGEHTSQLAREIGDAINVSPSKLENLIRGYTGGLGMMALDAIDDLARYSGIVDLPVAPAPTGSDMVLIRRFVARFPTSNGQSIETFYQRYEEVRQAVATYRYHQKRDDEAAVEAYERDHEVLLNQAKAFASVAAELKTYRLAINGVRDDRSLTAEQKRRAIDLLVLEMTDVARTALEELYPVQDRP